MRCRKTPTATRTATGRDSGFTGTRRLRSSVDAGTLREASACAASSTIETQGRQSSQLPLDEHHHGPERDTGTLSNQWQSSDDVREGTLTLFPLKLSQLPEARIIAQRSPPRMDSQQSRREHARD